MPTSFHAFFATLFPGSSSNAAAQGRALAPVVA